MIPKMNFSSLETKCENQTLKLFKKQLLVYEKLLDFYFHISNQVKYSGKHVIDEQDLAIIVLNYRIINSISSCLVLMKKGYYNDAFSVLRTIQESNNLCKYFMQNPKAVTKWVDGKQIEPKEVKRELCISTSDNQAYGLLSDFTHTNFPAIEDHLLLDKKYKINKKDDSTKLDIRRGPRFNKKTVNISITWLWFETNKSMENFYNYFNKYYLINLYSRYEKKKKSIKTDFSIIAKSFRETMESKK